MYGSILSTHISKLGYNQMIIRLELKGDQWCIHTIVFTIIMVSRLLDCRIDPFLQNPEVHLQGTHAIFILKMFTIQRKVAQGDLLVILRQTKWNHLALFSIKSHFTDGKNEAQRYTA